MEEQEGCPKTRLFRAFFKNDIVYSHTLSKTQGFEWDPFDRVPQKATFFYSLPLFMNASLLKSSFQRYNGRDSSYCAFWILYYFKWFSYDSEHNQVKYGIFTPFFKNHFSGDFFNRVGIHPPMPMEAHSNPSLRKKSTADLLCGHEPIKSDEALNRV